MAKNYSKTLTLQDNFTDVMKKAVAETKKLQDAMTQISRMEVKTNVNRKALDTMKKDMDKLSKAEIAVKAKLDSSVYSTINHIDKAVVPHKTIKITAKDELTHTVTNIERNLFSMQNRLEVGMQNPFRNFTSSAKGAVNALTGLKSMVRFLGSGAAVGSVMAPLLGGAAAGRALGGGKTFALFGRAATTHRVSRAAPINPKRGGRGFIGAIRGGMYDAFAHFKNRQNGYVDDGDVLNALPDVSAAWDSQSNFTKMINRQKEAMARCCNSNYLSKYQNISVGYNPRLVDGEVEFEGTFDALIKSKNKAEIAIGNLWQHVARFAANSKKRIDAAFDSVWNSSFVVKGRDAITMITNAASRAGMRVGFAFQRGGYYASNVLTKLAMNASTIHTKFKPIVMKIKDNAAVKTLSNITQKVVRLAGKTFTFTMNMAGSATKAVSGLLGGVKNFAGGALLAGGAAALGGLASGVKGAASQEQNAVSMAHFIGLSNGQGSNAKVTQKATQDYMIQLNKMANKTPFSNAEVMDAGRRAVNVTGGDTKAAMNLTKLAGNMAALNPGKSVMDAMEALADLKVGETERMKEFGFKISAHDIKKAGGAEAYFKNQTAGNGAIGKTFTGGADKISKTASGQWSTFTGNAQASLAKFGAKILPALTNSLGSINKWFDENEATIDRWVNAFGVGFEKVLSSVGPIKSAIRGMFNKINSDGKVSAGIINSFKTIFKTAVDIITPVAKFMGHLLSKVFAMVAGKINVVTNIIGYLGEIWQGIWPTIQSVLEATWSVMEPIFNTLMSVAQIIADIFMLAWPGIKATIEALWAGIKPIFDLMAGALEKISKFAGWVADKLHGAVKGKEDAEKAADSVNEDGSRRAVGISYVPRNDWMTRLHEGERVLTKTENRNYGQGNNNSYHIDVHVNGAQDAKTVAREVVKELQRATVNMGGGNGLAISA